jgi:hypothetical protein
LTMRATADLAMPLHGPEKDRGCPGQARLQPCRGSNPPRLMSAMPQTAARNLARSRRPAQTLSGKSGLLCPCKPTNKRLDNRIASSWFGLHSSLDHRRLTCSRIHPVVEASARSRTGVSLLYRGTNGNRNGQMV